jgi:hypothetical protein
MFWTEGSRLHRLGLGGGHDSPAEMPNIRDYKNRCDPESANVATTASSLTKRNWRSALQDAGAFIAGPRNTDRFWSAARQRRFPAHDRRFAQEFPVNATIWPQVSNCIHQKMSELQCRAGCLPYVACRSVHEFSGLTASRWQKSPNRSPAKRPAANCAKSGRSSLVISSVFTLSL